MSDSEDTDDKPVIQHGDPLYYVHSANDPLGGTERRVPTDDLGQQKLFDPNNDATDTTEFDLLESLEDEKPHEGVDMTVLQKIKGIADRGDFTFGVNFNHQPYGDQASLIPYVKIHYKFLKEALGTEPWTTVSLDAVPTELWSKINTAELVMDPAPPMFVLNRATNAPFLHLVRTPGVASYPAAFDHSDLGRFVLMSGYRALFSTAKVAAAIEWLTTQNLVVSDSTGDPFTSIALNAKTGQVKTDLIFFRDNKAWFAQRDLNYARSYLLYGPPGNGKTSIARVMAKSLGATPETFDFSATYEAPDMEFNEWVTQPSRNTSGIRFLLLEDIDRYYPRDQPARTSVSLSAVLNAFDGVRIREGSVLVASANHPDNLDKEVILRPGRFNLRVEFEPPSIEEAKSFLTRLFRRESVTQEMIAKIAARTEGHSYAFLKELLATSGTLQNLRGAVVIEDADIEGAVETHLGSSVTRSIKAKEGRVGF